MQNKKITTSSLNQMKEDVIKSLKLVDDPNTIITEFNKLHSKNNKNNKELNETLVKASVALGLDTHIPVLYAIYKGYRSLAIEFANNLIKEFKVHNENEKAIVHMIVTSYIRCMVLSEEITKILEDGKISENINKFYATTSKDLDRAHRQFTSALTLLKELKSPTIQVNVKTNTAFIAQNQQLNNQQYENNNP